MIKLAQDTITRGEVDSLREWLGTYPQLTKGELTPLFEERWSKVIGVGHSTFVNSGSSAILLALSALMQTGRIRRGGTVVVPAVSWLTDVSSPMNLGLNVMLCDCNMTDLSLDLAALSKILASERVDAVIVVSVLGLSPDMGRLQQMCRDAGVAVVEDVCESLGTDYSGRMLGTFGDVSVFSTYYGHHVSTIEGGMVCTNDEDLHLTVNAMRSHGWARDWPPGRREAAMREHKIAPFDEAYTFYMPGYNLRNTDIGAFLGLSQVETIVERAAIRHAVFLEYQRAIGGPNPLDLDAAAIRSNVVSSFAYPVLFP